MCKQFVAFGPISDIDRFSKECFSIEKDEKEAKEVKFLDFDKIIPCPPEYKTIEGYNRGGYEWCVNNWGTKWNTTYSSPIKTSCVSKTKKKIKQTFSTAWNPPLPIIEKLSCLYPTIIFTINFYEGGMEFCGKRTMENGKILEDLTKKYTGTLGG